jgi:hypothetical protein
VNTAIMTSLRPGPGPIALRPSSQTRPAHFLPHLQYNQHKHPDSSPPFQQTRDWSSPDSAVVSVTPVIASWPIELVTCGPPLGSPPLGSPPAPCAVVR